MKDFVAKYKSVLPAVFVGLIHTGITFVTDRYMFSFPAPDAEHYDLFLMDYILCKLIVCVFLSYTYYYLCKMIVSKTVNRGTLWQIIRNALPYLLVIVAVCAFKLREGYLSNDEVSIVQSALKFEHNTWFSYLTVYFYIVSLMIIPNYYGPIFMKLLIEFLTVGYVVYRFRKHFSQKWGYVSYGLFLLYPVLAYTTSAHRLPIYFLLYLFLFTKLIFDAAEHHELSYKEGGWMLFLSCILTQWRTEGIYLAVLFPILLFIAYSNIRSKRLVILTIVTAILMQYCISIPQNGLTAKGLDDAANDRMKPFYAYTIVNMCRNGLDRTKNAEDLAIVDAYLSMERIDAINEHYMDINYEDVLILYDPDYIGVRPEAGVTEFVAYSDACKRIFIHNPDVFIKTRIGAFCYAALPYHIDASAGIVSLVVSVVKTVMYNLFIPLLIILFICVWSLIKKKWVDFFVTGGLLAHWFIVFILAPASYFKYYFPVYIMAYFYVMYLLVYMICHKSKAHE